jgi:hypothetical protein
LTPYYIVETLSTASFRPTVCEQVAAAAAAVARSEQLGAAHEELRTLRAEMLESQLAVEQLREESEAAAALVEAVEGDAKAATAAARKAKTQAVEAEARLLAATREQAKVHSLVAATLRRVCGVLECSW